MGSSFVPEEPSTFETASCILLGTPVSISTNFPSPLKRKYAPKFHLMASRPPSPFAHV